jgi:hypothetical protein
MKDQKALQHEFFIYVPASQGAEASYDEQAVEIDGDLPPSVDWVNLRLSVPGRSSPFTVYLHPFDDGEVESAAGVVERAS